MRALAVSVVFALCACSPASPPAADERAATLPACDTIAFTGALTPVECGLQVGDYTLAVTYEAPPEGVTAGTVNAEVIGAGGSAVQTLLEPDVDEYRAPRVQDINGDGHADIIMVRTGGAPNAEMGLWMFNAERRQFERVGDVTAVSVERADGLIMAPARSSASEWEVAFYRLDEGGLQPFATLTVEPPVELPNDPWCRGDIPRLPGDDITTVSWRRSSLCAAAARVFE